VEQGVALDAKYDQDNKLVTVFGVGGIYDPGKSFLAAEWGMTDLHSALGRSSGRYASSGYRLAKFTPYLSCARSKSPFQRQSSGVRRAIVRRLRARQTKGVLE
jgi:hypothetical protein